MTILTTLGRGAAIAARTAFSWRGVSFVAGLVLLSGTLAILFYDVVALGAAFTLKHYQTLVIVAGTLLVGILAEQCIHKRKWLSSAGFWLLFAVGTALVIYSSVGRQGEKTMMSSAEHNKAVGEETDLKNQIEAERKKVDEKRQLADKACENRKPEHRKCAGPRATQSVYEASLAGLEARLKVLVPPKPVDPEAETFADTAAALGANRAKMLAIASPGYRYLVTLFFEFGTIWCFARAFGPERIPVAARDSAARSRPRAEPTQLGSVSDAELSAIRQQFAVEQPNGSPNSPRDGGSPLPQRKPNGPKPNGSRFTKEEAAADLVTRLALGERFGSQDEMRERYGVAKSTMSDWLKEWEAGGLIPARTQQGRCKSLIA